ncbi:hypothetical protein EDB80DRAFT_692221 [Ilyonectria destructans]|nr:hypothetical protein EDB80DRAFT_692221 [Ilyonectria destructans]
MSPKTEYFIIVPFLLDLLARLSWLATALHETDETGDKAYDLTIEFNDMMPTPTQYNTFPTEQGKGRCEESPSIYQLLVLEQETFQKQLHAVLEMFSRAVNLLNSQGLLTPDERTGVEENIGKVESELVSVEVGCFYRQILLELEPLPSGGAEFA